MVVILRERSEMVVILRERSETQDLLFARIPTRFGARSLNSDLKILLDVERSRF
jgi:hypothetical protein